jgi:sortase (surface protein transpeptidase)
MFVAEEAFVVSHIHELSGLVTCYPFYVVGSAPKRYIVQASMNTPNPENIDAAEQIKPGGKNTHH